MAGWKLRRRAGGLALAVLALIVAWVAVEGPADAPTPDRAAESPGRAAPVVEAASPADTHPASSDTGGKAPLPLTIPATYRGRDLAREVQDALAQDTPTAALTAAELIDRCLKVDRRVTELLEAQSQQSFQDVVVKKMLGLFGLDERRLIEISQQEQRHCQGLDAQTRAMRPALLQKALDGAVEGAAQRYLEWLVETQGDKTDPAQLQVLRQRIREEADAGSMVAMYALASEKLPLAVSAEARHSYLRATDHIEESWVKDEAMAGFLKPVLAMRQLLGGRGADPSLTPEQLQAAEQQALRLFEAYRHRELARHRSVG